MENDPLRDLRRDFASQRDFVVTRAPIYAPLLDELADLLDGPSAGPSERLSAAWRGRRFGAYYERPLLLLAALRADALRGGGAHPLWAAIASPEPDASAITPENVARALSVDRTQFWSDLATRHVQTNELSRAIAWLWPAHLAALGDPARAIRLYDVGASAGLNLVADSLQASWSRADGSPIVIEPRPPIAARIGFDPRPLDVRDEDDARWLRACIWPGLRDRSERLEAALAAFEQAASDDAPPELVTASAAEIPGRLPRFDASGPRGLVYQTIVRDYLSAGEREAYAAAMRRWLSECAAGAALWIELELHLEERAGKPPAELTAHIATGGGHRSLRLAECDPHPRVLIVDEAAVTELRDRLA
jgi:hypothetical protein